MLKSAGRFIYIYDTKQYSPPSELLTILQNRGLDCSDTENAENFFRSIGYYRLSSYLYPFLKAPKSDHKYKNLRLNSDVRKLHTDEKIPKKIETDIVFSKSSLLVRFRYGAALIKSHKLIGFPMFNLFMVIFSSCIFTRSKETAYVFISNKEQDDFRV